RCCYGAAYRRRILCGTRRRQILRDLGVIDTPDKAEAPLVVRSDKLLVGSIVADGLARRANARAERRLRDDPAHPYDIDELAFTDDSIAVPNKVNEQIENLWLDRNELSAAPQLVLRDIDFKIGKAKNQGAPTHDCEIKFATD